MTITGHKIDLANVTRLIDDPRLKPAHLSEASAETFENIMKAQESYLKSKYTAFPDYSQNPAYKPYAQVIVNGRSVAEIDNHGITATSNAMGAKIGRNLPNEGANGEITGPALAKARAEYIARELGGKVVMADTALSQRQFSAIPALKPTVDMEALRKDPQYQKLLELRQMRTEFLAQKLGQEMEETMAAGLDTVENPADQENGEIEKSAAEKFLDYMNMSTEERYWYSFLKAQNMTQEEFDALPPEEKQAMMEQFEEEFKEQLAQEALEKQQKEMLG